MKKLITIILLIIAVVLIALTLILAAFWESLGLSSKQLVIFPFLFMISFGINIAGLIFSFVERKKNKKSALIGTIGHSSLIICFIALVVYSISTMPPIK